MVGLDIWHGKFTTQLFGRESYEWLVLCQVVCARGQSSECCGLCWTEVTCVIDALLFLDGLCALSVESLFLCGWSASDSQRDLNMLWAKVSEILRDVIVRVSINDVA